MVRKLQKNYFMLVLIYFVNQHKMPDAGERSVKGGVWIGDLGFGIWDLGFNGETAKRRTARETASGYMMTQLGTVTY